MAKKENDKLIMILSYFIIGIIWYFVDDKQQSKNTKFHVKQALNLFVLAFGISILFGILFGILGFVTFGIFNIFAGPINVILQLILLVLWIIGIINAINGKNKELPVIGAFAKKYLTF